MNPQWLAWLRAHGAAVGLFALLAAWYLPWTWSDQLGSLGGDSAVYVLTARHYAPTLPADAVAADTAQRTLYPPLYPLVLGLAGAAADLRWAHAVTTACLLAGLVALYALTLALTASRALALVAVALFALAPGTWLEALQLQSEPLYVALSLAAVALLLLAGRSRNAAAYWCAAASVSAALMTRSAGVALLPALALALIRQRPRAWPAMLALALAPAVAWATLHHPEFGYGESLAGPLAGLSPAQLLARLLVQAQAATQGVVANFLQTSTLRWALLPLGLMAVAAAARRFVQLQPDAWYFFAYAGLMILWPYPVEAQRLAWVLSPLLLAYALHAADALAAGLPLARPLVQRGLRWSVPAVLLLVLAPGFALANQRRSDPLTRDEPALRYWPEFYRVNPATAATGARLQLALARAIAQLGGEVPPDECVFAIKPTLVAYFARRTSYATPRASVDDSTFAAQVAERGCRYFLVLDATSPSYAVPLYPMDRLRDAEVVASQRYVPDAEPLIGMLVRAGPPVARP